MSQDSETRVTRGALRRLSVEREPTVVPGTPKKTVAKKVVVLDAIAESGQSIDDPVLDKLKNELKTGRESPRLKSLKTDSPAPNNKAEDVANNVDNKETTPKTRRTRLSSLTQENVEMFNLSIDKEPKSATRPKRRASIDAETPNTVPMVVRRTTRRNSITSEEGPSTPKAKPTVYVIPTEKTITEDEENELDIRKLRNRSISNSPVNNKKVEDAKNLKVKLVDINTEAGVNLSEHDVVDISIVEDGGSVKNKTLANVSLEEAQKDVSKIDVDASIADSRIEMVDVSNVEAVDSVKNKTLKNVTFDEAPNDDSKIAFPKTPKSTVKSKSYTNAAADVVDSDQDMFDKSFENIVKDVFENINKADVSTCVLDTPKVNRTSKLVHSESSQLSCSTPISSKLQTVVAEKKEEDVAVAKSPQPDVPEKTEKAEKVETAENESKFSKSWNQSVTGTVTETAFIDGFGIAKEKERKEEELSFNKSQEQSKKKISFDDEESDEERKDSMFIDDEAMEVDGYESGDSQSTETKLEIKANTIPTRGISITSEEDSRDDENDDYENDSFIVDDEDEPEVVDDSGDDLEALIDDSQDKEEEKPKTRKRINQIMIESSDEEQDVGATKPSNGVVEEIDLMTEESYDSCEIVNVSKKSAKRSSKANVISSDEESFETSVAPDKSIEDIEPQEVAVEAVDKKKLNETSETTLTADTSASIKDDSGSVEPERISRRKSICSGGQLEKEVEDDVVETEVETVEAEAASVETVVETVEAEAETVEKVVTRISPRKSISSKIESPKIAEDAVGQSPRTKASSPSEEAIQSVDIDDTLPQVSQQLPEEVAHVEKTPTRISARKSISNRVLVDPVQHSPRIVPQVTENEPMEVDSDPEEVSVPKISARKSIGPPMNGQEAPMKPPRKSIEKPKLDSSQTWTEEKISSPAKQKSRASMPAVLHDIAASNSVKKQNRKSLAVLAKVDEPKVSPRILSAKKAKRRSNAEVGETQESAKKKIKLDTGSTDVEVPKTIPKKKKELTMYNIDAILERCNEVLRADKEKKKTSSSIQRQKKEEKKKLKEQQKLEELVPGATTEEESPEKKKKKKKKKINYLLSEASEEKREHIAQALKRKQEIIELKRLRKKERKNLKKELGVTKVTDDKKKIKGNKKPVEKPKPVVVQPEVPVRKSTNLVSAFAVLKATQVDQSIESKRTQTKLDNLGKVMESLCNQNNEENEASLANALKKTKKKKDKTPVKNTLQEIEINEENEASVPNALKKTKKKKDKTPVKSMIQEIENNEENDASAPNALKTKKKKKDNSPVKNTIQEVAEISLGSVEKKKKKKKRQQLEESLVDNSMMDTNMSVPEFEEMEKTPPRKSKLKIVGRIESGFYEEPVTPMAKLLKKNSGFVEEPKTPKAIGFKVSRIMPAGQDDFKLVEELKPKRKHQPLKEYTKALPQPIWTASGQFQEEPDMHTNKKNQEDFIPLSAPNSSTQFLIKPLGSKKSQKHKANQIDENILSADVINFKKMAIQDKNSHLREGGKRLKK